MLKRTTKGRVQGANYFEFKTFLYPYYISFTRV